MQRQNYKNHIKYYIPHHAILLPLLAAALITSCIRIFTHPLQRELYVWISITLFFIFYTVVMLRQHYALGNQNRIVRLEMRLRYYQLTGNSFQPYEEKLSFGQVAALRFASNEELPALLQRAITEQLSPKMIKQSIKNWQGDYLRV